MGSSCYFFHFHCSFLWDVFTNLKHENMILWATHAGSNTFPADRCRVAHSFMNAKHQGGNEINITLLETLCNCLATECWDYPAQDHWASVVIFFQFLFLIHFCHSEESGVLYYCNCLAPCLIYTVYMHTWNNLVSYLNNFPNYLQNYGIEDKEMVLLNSLIW